MEPEQQTDNEEIEVAHQHEVFEAVKTPLEVWLDALPNVLDY